MFSLLRVSDKKLTDKEIKRVEERVTSIEKEIGRVNDEEIINSLIEGFKNGLNAEIEEGELSNDEAKIAQNLVKKYESKEWNFKR